MKSKKLIIIVLIVLAAILVLASAMALFIQTKTPTTPQTFIVTPGNTNVTLTWEAPTDNGGSPVIEYKLYRSTASNGEYSLIASPTSTIYTDEDRTNGQVLWYRVSASNAAGEGAKTENVSAIPFTVPNAPTGLMEIAGNAQVGLNWTAPSYDGGRVIDYYLVYQDGNELPGHINGSATIIANLTNGQDYVFRVAAHNLAGVSITSNAISGMPFTVPHAPTGLKGIEGNALVTLNWTEPSINGGISVSGYNLYRSTSSDGNYTLIASPQRETFTDTNLVNGQSYWYKVSAVNSAGEGEMSGPSEVIQNIPASFIFQDVLGIVNDDFTLITNLTIQMRLGAGSPSIQMDQVSIQYISGEVNDMLTFANGTDNALAGINYGSSHYFSPTWNEVNHLVQPGDLVVVTITGLSLGHEASAQLKIVPANGSSTLTSIVTPSYYNVTYVNLK